ncbi:hypothetical protein [Kineobactrum salinum]|uniref:Uncharacterized protein n=1 Tax=Kineobactrum salinum TaxID=2708301 RepID=A0A6C0TY05_9GAMM|nr:hypothetical protein [Kineobactrum salinum]QIB64710.1 hypothetical protein G3T16_04200 [Kineobactrum salinum]
MQESACQSAIATGLNRDQIIERQYAGFCTEIGVQPSRPDLVAGRSPERIVTHQLLRQKLLSDPAMAALLPSAQCFIALGREGDMPFRLKSPDLLLIPPTLLSSVPAIAAVTRWGLEAASVVQRGELSYSKLLGVLRHGSSLLKMLTISDRALVLNGMPEDISREMIGSRMMKPSSTLMSWLVDMVGIKILPPTEEESEVVDSALSLPIEHLLSSNGDSRLVIDGRTGKNRYGTTVRPRPEAVHFSSSTASSISDHGFMVCDVLRRDLALQVLEKHDSNHGVRRALSDAVVATLRELCGLADEEADGVIAPSGTDTEVLSVLLALAAGKDTPLVNVLVSPEETGRGVKLAASGCYFDDQSSTGVEIGKGQTIWSEVQVSVLNVGLRDAAGAVLHLADVDREFETLGMAALEQGSRVLAHVLLGSKTGLSGPSLTVVDKLVALAPDRVDVVVDACQMRIDFHELGALVRRGWMVQLSGSKALTGPAFSGAILVPLSMRERIDGVKALMQPGAGYSEDWSRWWSAQMTLPRVTPSLVRRSVGCRH